jgi:DNA-binding response OmpR family regulator
MKTIVLVQNEPEVFSTLKSGFELEGFRVIGAETARQALELCQRQRPDMLILDVTLPDCDGFEACRMLQRNPQLMGIPFIFITARDSETDRLIGLELGARDYIVKPFYIREVIARIRAQLRVLPEANPILRAGTLEMDRRACQVTIGNRLVSLTATEFNLLEHLMRHPKIVFGRSQLLDAVWGHRRVVSERTVDVFMLRLRRKLGSNEGKCRFLHSVRGFGYQFDPDHAELSPDHKVKSDAGREFSLHSPKLASSKLAHTA